MGQVLLARDEGLAGRLVAIKVMLAGGAGSQGLAWFQREMLATSKMQHPNIVTLFTTGVHNGKPFMVMEYLEGEDLGRTARLLGADEVARIGRETCAALEYAHAQGVVHRDIKPGNIIMCKNGLVKVTDFGVAKALSASQATVSGSVVGTPGYMAPEQWLGEPAAAGFDIWATGCTLYELLAGRRAREYSAFGEYVAAAARGERVPGLRGAAAGVPSWLADAVMAMLEPDPARRPTAAQCRQLLSGPQPDSRYAATASLLPPRTPARSSSPSPSSRPVRQQPVRQTRSRLSSAVAQPETRSLLSPSSGAPARVPTARGANRVPPATGSGPPARRRGKLWTAIIAVIALTAAVVAVTAHLLNGPSWIPAAGTMYVTTSDGIVPLNLVTGQTGKPVQVNGSAEDIELGPQAGTAYIDDVTACQDCAGTVGIGSLRPVNLDTGSAGRAVWVAQAPGGTTGYLFPFVLAKDGTAAYVLSSSGVQSIDLATGRARALARVGSTDSEMALSRDGGTLYVTADQGREIVPVNLRDGALGRTLKLPSTILAMAVAPGNTGVYVYDAGGFASVSTETGRVTWQIASPELGDGGATQGSIVLAPDGRTAYAGGAGTGVVPIDLTTHKAGQLIQFEAVVSMAISPDGRVLYVAGADGDVLPINVATRQVGKAVPTGSDLQGMAIAA
jgi:serine/threonine-protein kinase